MGGGPGTDLLDEMELASEMVSSSPRRREEAGMTVVAKETTSKMQAAPAG